MSAAPKVLQPSLATLCLSGRTQVETDVALAEARDRVAQLEAHAAERDAAAAAAAEAAAAMTSELRAEVARHAERATEAERAAEASVGMALAAADGRYQELREAITIEAAAAVSILGSGPAERMARASEELHAEMATGRATAAAALARVTELEGAIRQLRSEHAALQTSAAAREASLASQLATARAERDEAERLGAEAREALAASTEQLAASSVEVSASRQTALAAEGAVAERLRALQTELASARAELVDMRAAKTHAEARQAAEAEDAAKRAAELARLTADARALEVERNALRERVGPLAEVGAAEGDGRRRAEAEVAALIEALRQSEGWLRSEVRAAETGVRLAVRDAQASYQEIREEALELARERANASLVAELEARSVATTATVAALEAKRVAAEGTLAEARAEVLQHVKETKRLDTALEGAKKELEIGQLKVREGAA